MTRLIAATILLVAFACKTQQQAAQNFKLPTINKSEVELSPNQAIANIVVLSTSYKEDPSISICKVNTLGKRHFGFDDYLPPNDSVLIINSEGLVMKETYDIVMESTRKKENYITFRLIGVIDSDQNN